MYDMLVDAFPLYKTPQVSPDYFTKIFNTISKRQDAVVPMFYQLVQPI
jgi:hypothetical protein